MPVNPFDFEYQFSASSLKEVRDWMGVSQAQLGEMLALPTNTISRWERGETTPDANSLAAVYSIAKGHQLTPEFFQRRSSMVVAKLKPPKSHAVDGFIKVVKATNGQPTRMTDLGQGFRKVMDGLGIEPQDLGFGKNHPTKSILTWLEEQLLVEAKPAPKTQDSVIVVLKGQSKTKQGKKKPGEAAKKDFTIQRKGQTTFERTVIGKTGQTYTYQNVTKKGKDGHFTDEGKYRRAIEQAVRENSQ